MAFAAWFSAIVPTCCPAALRPVYHRIQVVACLRHTEQMVALGGFAKY